MKFNFVDEIPHPRSVVFSTHRDRLQELVPYLGNIDRIETPVREDDGPTVHFENVWYGSSDDVPAVVRHILTPELLKWVDRATWNAKTWRCDWDIQLHALPGAITAKGTNRFRDEGDDTVIETNGEFTIHPDRLPGVPTFAARRAAPVLERFVLSLLQPNLKGSNRAVTAYIEDHPRGASPLPHSLRP